MTNKKPCPAVQVNVRVPDFGCKMDQGHGGPHVDPRTGTPWDEGKLPRGMRRKQKVKRS